MCTGADPIGTDPKLERSGKALRTHETSSIRSSLDLLSALVWIGKNSHNGLDLIHPGHVWMHGSNLELVQIRKEACFIIK